MISRRWRWVELRRIALWSRGRASRTRWRLKLRITAVAPIVVRLRAAGWWWEGGATALTALPQTLRELVEALDVGTCDAIAERARREIAACDAKLRRAADG